MTINPIIPIWAMAILSVVLIALKRKGWVSFVRQILIVLLLFAINLRVMIPDKEHPVNEPQIDAYVLIAVDSTISMLADDMPKDDTRLDAVKADMKTVVEEMNGAKFAVIDFNNGPRLITPFTDDVNRVKSSIDIISPVNSNYAQGSSFNNCKSLIIEQLKVAYEKEDANIYLFFISDGESNQDGEKIESFSGIKKYLDGGSVLGYGTSKGGKMKVSTYSGTTTVKTKDGKDAVSKLNEDNLVQIAKEMDISYVNMKNHSSINEVIQDVLDDVNETMVEKVEFAYKETYYFFLPPLIVLLVWDFIHFKRKV